MPTSLLIALAVMVALAIVAIYASLAAAGAVLYVRHRRRQRETLRPMADLVHKPVLVTTRDRQSIQGILLDEDEHWLLLAQPEYLQGVRPAGIGGRVFIPMTNFSWGHEIPVGALAAADDDARQSLAAVS